MEKLDYLEVKIVNHCNYNCRACCACSNIAQRIEYDEKEFEGDVKRISELLKIGVFRIMGGEPLLSKNIKNYLTISRNYLPDTDIRIVTNGSLISKMDQSFFDLLTDVSVKVDISYYVGKDEKSICNVDEGIRKLEDNKIPYEVNKRTYFYLTMNKDNPSKDYDAIYRNCRARLQCNNMFHGKIYPCIQSCSFYQYDEKFNTSFFQYDDGIDIYDPNIKGEDILYRLESHIEFCRHCAMFPSYFTWQEGVPLANDWMICSDNELYKNQISYYDYIVEDKRTDLNVAQVYSNNNIDFILLNSNSLNTDKRFIDKPVYIWMESDNCYHHFEQFVKIEFLKHNFMHDGIISNSFVQSLNCNIKLIDKEHIQYPCNIVFFPPTGRPLIQSLRNVRKRLLAMKR